MPSELAERLSRWEREEKLPYPLVSVPLEVAEGEPSAAAPLLRSPLMWAAFALPCVHYTLQGLNGYWPEIPYITLERTMETRFTGPLAAYNGLLLWLRMDMVGIAYLLAAEVGFSLWFFFLLRRAQQAVRLALGFTSGELRSSAIRAWFAWSWSSTEANAASPTLVNSSIALNRSWDCCSRASRLGSSPPTLPGTSSTEASDAGPPPPAVPRA